MKRGKRAIGVVLVLAALLIGLLCRQVDLLYRQEERNHALIAAIKAQNRPRALELLDDGADANARDTGENPSFKQICENFIDQYGRHTPPVSPDAYPSALILASRRVKISKIEGSFEERSPNEEIVLALLERGAKPDVNEISDEEGASSPLGYALQNRQYRVLRRLLECGANPNSSAFWFVRKRSILEEPPIVRLCWLNVFNADVANLLLEHGADVNKTDSDGKTPLIVSALTDNVEGVLWLLKQGAKPGIKDQEGQTALSIATENVQQGGRSAARKIATLLRRYGATK